MGSQRSVVQIAVLFAVSLLLLAPFSRSGLDAWLQSPISPVTSSTSPVVPDIVPDFSPVSPHAEVAVPTPTSLPASSPSLFGAAFWSSLLLWIALGVVIFGGAAYALVVYLTRFEPTKRV